jgi:hypothetical protein
MSKKAEDAALKRFPVEMTRIPYQDLIEAFGGKEYVDFNLMPRGYFQLGYEQAEKDLAMSYPLPEDTVLFQKGVEEGRRLEKDDIALSWEDMAKIDAIILDANNEFAVDYSKEINRQKFYEEVLKRFKEAKK